MKVVILAGGYGTRLREETEYRPKPLLNIGSHPIMWHIMKNYAHFGFNEFIICLGYKGEMIKEYFLNYEAMNNDFTINLGRRNEIIYHSAHEEQNFQITLADTGIDSQTAHRVKLVEQYIGDEPFMVTYGDGLSNLDIGELVAFHKNHGKLATVTSVRPISRYGTLTLDAQSRVTSFREKPQLNDWVNAGFMVFQREALDYIDPHTNEELPDTLEKLATDLELVAYKHDGFFLGMDTHKEHQYLNDLWKQGNAPWKAWESNGHGG